MIRVWYQHGHDPKIAVQEDDKQRYFVKTFEMKNVNIKISEDNALVMTESDGLQKRTVLEITDYKD